MPRCKSTKSQHSLRVDQWIADAKPCVICGIRQSIDREHVPPRNIFTKPRPSNLVTVPACSSCNNNTSQLDEEFRAYLSLKVGTSSHDSLDFWAKYAFPTIQSNARLKRQINEWTREVEVFSEAGLYLGNAPALFWEVKKHDLIIEKTIRGLYWKHYNDILGGQVKLRIQWLRGLSDEIKEMLNRFRVERIGSAFIYAYRRADDLHQLSAWLLEFYGTHLVDVLTEPDKPIGT